MKAELTKEQLERYAANAVDNHLKLMAIELLAVREALEKPVAIVENSEYVTFTGPIKKAVRELFPCSLHIGMELFTVPQAYDKTKPLSQQPWLWRGNRG
ncbi:hypothetical protein ABMA09_22570 [Erwinia rhapontici]|uniref:hypothetical protein n=1 Tax=Erwinia rhapontici TaxID=55212 RepID=UPI003D36FFAE